mmetsp:Transcript_74298/g.124008  ORF Transcript_74298/g.124008 Transcript_74298/m.124008 type:complete len:138 (+) Transcript_74298:2-415(+)
MSLPPVKRKWGTSQDGWEDEVDEGIEEWEARDDGSFSRVDKADDEQPSLKKVCCAVEDLAVGGPLKERRTEGGFDDPVEADGYNENYDDDDDAESQEEEDDDEDEGERQESEMEDSVDDPCEHVPKRPKCDVSAGII